MALSAWAGCGFGRASGAGAESGSLASSVGWSLAIAWATASGLMSSFGWIAAVYTIFMFIAAGLKYVLLVAVLFVPGTILYVWARREQKLQLFTPVEIAVFAVTLVAGLVGAYGLLTGIITP